MRFRAAPPVAEPIAVADLHAATTGRAWHETTRDEPCDRSPPVTTTLSSVIGSTPVVALPDLLQADTSPIAKLEKFNPGGSVKDRVAAYIFERVISGFGPSWKGPIVESSSGNLGIALAMLGAARGIEVVIVVDPNTSAQNIAIMRAYGATIEIERERDSKGLFHETKLARARKISEQRGGYWVNQTANLLNGEAHRETTGREIAETFGDALDVVAVATSSGGQLRGIADAIRRRAPNVDILAVDAVGSQIFSKNASNYVTPGLGLSWKPVLIDNLFVNSACLVDDALSFSCARYLAQHGLLVGPSSGAVAAACYKVQMQDPKARVLGILSDGGERYLDTLFNDDWIKDRGLSVDSDPQHIVARIAGLELKKPHA